MMEKNESLVERLNRQAGNLQKEIQALFLAYRDPRTPLTAKVVAVLVVGYALSPIDLIPDFIPVLGYLDDLIILPAGIALALKLIPVQVIEDARQEVNRAEETGGKAGLIGAVIIVLVWLVILAVLALVGLRLYKRFS